MAKGARASTKKANHAALKAKVFGPVETARAERLHAKLMELASQPKPSAKAEDVDMDGKEGKDSAEGGKYQFYVIEEYALTRDQQGLEKIPRTTMLCLQLKRSSPKVSFNISKHLRTTLQTTDRENCRDGSRQGQQQTQLESVEEPYLQEEEQSTQDNDFHNLQEWEESWREGWEGEEMILRRKSDHNEFAGASGNHGRSLEFVVGCFYIHI
jgi:hypothetical protein